MLPGPGDQVDPAARAGAVGEHRDRLGAADGVDLLDAEQRAGGQDRGVRQAAVVRLRRGGEGDRADAGDLGGHDVHQHAGDQRREPAGHVETDPVDRHLAVGDPWRRGRGRWRRPCSSSASQVGRSRRIDSSRPARTPGPGRSRASASAAAGTRMSSAATPSNRSEYSRIASTPRTRTSSQIACTAGHRRLDVEVGARHDGAVVDGAGAGGPAQVDAADHGLDSR